MDGLNKRMFDLQITLVDGILNYDILNAKLFNEKSKSWEENNVFLFFSKNNFFSKINAGVEEVMLNDEMYNEAKNRKLKSILLYLALIALCMLKSSLHTIFVIRCYFGTEPRYQGKCYQSGWNKYLW